MNIDEILVLGTGLSLFAGSKKEIAKRAKCSPTMVNKVLRGKGGDTATSQRVLKKAQELYEELTAMNAELSKHLAKE